MKTTALSLLLIAITSAAAFAVDATGIKTKNLEGADLALMENHDPASELENFELLEGFQANLFAADPMLANPIHMHWDARGRLWVACSWTYPQISPGQEANDKIIILEDTDNDGRADKSTVFADGLYMPIGIELSNGGVYVAQTPDVLFLKDTDGDDVADVRDVVLTGFGIEDSHHSISAWRRGPGGWIYFQEGIFLHTQVETQHGLVRNYNGGIYQYNPRTGVLNVFANAGGGNPWGHVFDDWGQSFQVNNPRICYVTPVTGNGGVKLAMPTLRSTEKQCGGDIITGTHFPPEMQGQLFTGRFKSRQLIRYEFTEDESGFSANVLEPLIKSKHPNFRPVDSKIGPDGAIYIADWYNSIINHAQHDFRDPRRDHGHGRIWRITHKTRPLVEKPQLVGVPLPELVAHLASPNAWTRHHARLVLSEHEDPDAAAEAVRDFAKNGVDPGDPRHDHHLVEAMWAMQNLERVDEDILQQVLAAGDGHARSAGARIIRYWHEELTDPVALIGELAADPFPRVRLEAILSAGFLHKAEALPAALVALDHPRDKFIDMALPQTVSGLAPYTESALNSGELTFAKPEHRDFAMREAGLGFDQRLGALLKEKSPSSEDLKSVSREFASLATDSQVRQVARALASKRKAPAPETTVALLAALEPIGRRAEIGTGKEIEALARHLNSKDDALVAATARALGAWRVSKANKQLASIAADEKRDLSIRRAAVVALGVNGRPEAIVELEKLGAAKQPLALRYLAAEGLAAADLKAAGTATATLFVFDPEGADPVALVTAFTTRRSGANALTGALRDADIHPGIVEAVATHQRHTGSLPANLANLFQPAATSGADLLASLLAEKQSDLTAAVEAEGDPARGESIYRRKASACTSCHAIDGAGPKIGPDLVAVGAAATTDYIVESILQPNKSIAEHYETVAITTDDGGFHMGVIDFKSEEKIVLHSSVQPGVDVEIPAKSVLKIAPMPSLMPPGLAAQLQSRQEFLDLTKFVSLLGRPGDYAPSTTPVIRTWRFLADEQPAAKLDASKIAPGALWLPLYSKVDGEIPAEDLASTPAAFLRGAVTIQQAGSVALDINNNAGLRLWIDGKEITDLAAPIKLDKGRREFTFLVDQAARSGNGFRVELTTPSGSAAKYQPVGGI